MVDRISSGSLAKAAIEAAMQRQAQAAQDLSARAQALAGGSSQPAAGGADFAGSLVQGLRDVDAQVRRADELVVDVVSGKTVDFAEVAAQLKQTDLAFKFALEVRNKFIDAYREVMRMSV